MSATVRSSNCWVSTLWTDANHRPRLAVAAREAETHPIQPARCSYILLDPELLRVRSEGRKNLEEVTRMRLASQSVRSISFLTMSVLLAALFSMAPPAEAAKNTLDAQLAFGIEMAKRGLWNEAIFRFSRVSKERPGDVRVLNNMAVAYEAIGQFDRALEHYKRALEGDSSNRDLRRNYAQFVEFYENLRPKTDDEAETPDSPTDSPPDASSESLPESSPESKNESARGEAAETGDSAEDSAEDSRR